MEQAGEAGIIGKPEDCDVSFEYVDDSDGGYYFFLVRIGYKLKLATHSYEMRKLAAERDAKGLPAALSILQEAVSSANSALSDLDEYVSSHRG